MCREQRLHELAGQHEQILAETRMQYDQRIAELSSDTDHKLGGETNVYRSICSRMLHTVCGGVLKFRYPSEHGACAA